MDHEKHPPIAALPMLPVDVRKRIYRYAGVYWPGQPYFFRLHEHSPLLFQADDLSQPTSGFYGLMLSCRATYNEISEMLYSLNHFVIVLTEGKGLEPLRSLTPSTLASLRHIKIVLYAMGCHNLHGRTTSISSIMDDWSLTATYLSRHIAPGKLELALVADVSDSIYRYKNDVADKLVRGLTPAARVVAPFYKAGMPPLGICHIRLCKDPNPELQEIADKAVSQACRRRVLPCSSSSSTFDSPWITVSSQQKTLGSRLLNLPNEILLQILEYTDLVAPWKEVTWGWNIGSDKSMYQVSKPVKVPCELWPLARPRETHGALNSHCPSDVVHHGCQFDRCWNTRNSSHSVRFLGGFCRRQHAAASSGPICKCWAPPTNILLTCRDLRDLGQAVFFSANRFILTHGRSAMQAYSGYFDVSYTKPHNRLAASQFLAEIVPERCLRDLRRLEIIIPNYSHASWSSPDRPEIKDWVQTLHSIKNKILGSALTIRLTLIDESWMPRPRQYGTPKRFYPTPVPLLTPGEEQDKAENVLNALALPLCILAQNKENPLAHVYCHFQSPLARQTAVSLESGYSYDTSVREGERVWAGVIENAIMGHKRWMKTRGKEPPTTLAIRLDQLDPVQCCDFEDGGDPDVELKIFKEVVGRASNWWTHAVKEGVQKVMHV
ncbi:hypothetical protein QBC43DRAFT_361727 [Cladorrhinum sp. PSN259]|nr:hypothetical protein QBC43DRAFT_361727 [Cladorrhinum sp. PSN259]